MPHESSSEQEPDDSDAEFVEIDPSGRYGRYKEVLGRGAFKKVYRAFDELEGIEVAWNQVKVTELVRNAVDLERLYSEVHLLQTLKHKNIIKFYNSWVDTKNENINFITEIFTSGTLRQYRKKHKNVDLRALKKWSRQILEGLLYLHSHDPPIIHRDLKCDNIFVNGNHGEVKIGDLGLATILQQARSAHSVIGTPEFMAPELYEEEYNELVDIYAFGMCLLELVTVEYPYVECSNAAQIFKKVTSGIKPASLAKVTDPTVRAFIEKCIAKVSNRLSAKELLMDPFLRSDEDGVGPSLQPQAHHSGGNSDLVNVEKTSGESAAESARDFHLKIITAGGNSDLVNVEKTSGESAAESARDFTVKSQMKDVKTMYLKLRITDSTGQCRNIHFPFDITVDTAGAVASEMVEELDLTDQDVSAIASMIESEIRSHIRDWEPGKYSPVHPGEAVVDSEISADETKGDTSPLTLDPIASLSSRGFERLPSGRKYWSDSPKTGSPSSRLGQSPPFEQPNSRFGDGNSPKDGMGAANQHDNEDDDYDGENEEEANEKGSNEVAENCGKFEECKPDLKMALEKVENLVRKQLKELNDLWKKHELELSDLLDDISPEFQRKVLEAYKTKLPNYTKSVTQK